MNKQTSTVEVTAKKKKKKQAISSLSYPQFKLFLECHLEYSKGVGMRLCEVLYMLQNWAEMHQGRISSLQTD